MLLIMSKKEDVYFFFFDFQMVKSSQLDEVIKSMKLLETKNENLTKTVSKRIPL